MKLGSLILILRAALIGASLCAPTWAQPAHGGATYFVDCGEAPASAVVSSAALPSSPTSPGVLLRSLSAVNYLQLAPGDSLLFKRGSTCRGALHPRGSGSAAAPIRVAAYGEGALPRITAAATDDNALSLFNQQFWELSSLDISGSRLSGIFVGGDAGTLRHIYLRDLHVHDVRGDLSRKESGLIVINPAHKTSHMDDVLLDGVQAYDTTQWSGIFISRATHVRVLDSLVHDVQGDGIAVFTTTDALIAHSAAWHTGMQHWQTIGTPNAIWTWRCTDCLVEDNEAFLSDSPGVDGGAFDIDFGNTRNTVRRNFAHDTAGYCVAVFGSLGLTLTSVIADNLCINNALSPRLAQRQGAMLIQTWQNGTITDVDIYGNRIDWQPPGASPAIQVGVGLVATGIRIHDNDIESSGPELINPLLPYTGEHNSLHTQDAFHPAFGMKATRTDGWRLEAHVPSAMLHGENSAWRALFVSLHSAALQFRHAGLQVDLFTEGDAITAATDWGLPAAGVVMHNAAAPAFALTLVSPDHVIAHEWKDDPGAIELGLALRQTVGPPVFGFLPIDKVAAH